MRQRWKAFVLGLGVTLIVIGVRGDGESIGGEQAREARRGQSIRRERPPMPEITRPVMFNTPEADAILAVAPGLPAATIRGTKTSRSGRFIPTRRTWSPRSAWRSAWPTTWTWRSSWCRRTRSVCRSRSTAIRMSRTPGRIRSPTTRRSKIGRSMASPSKSSSDEGEGDRHMLVVDPVKGMLFEFYQARKTDSGWAATQASIFDLKSNKLRPDGWTSTDAAGLPIFPAVVRYDEAGARHGRTCHAVHDPQFPAGLRLPGDPLSPAARPT